MYDTRIVKVGSDYFVEYRWAGPLWKGLLYGEPVYWSMYSMVPNKSLEDAEKTRQDALKSYELNYKWNTQIVG